eukprot:260316-Pleurochrysis_carterae.AAC.1
MGERQVAAAAQRTFAAIIRTEKVRTLFDTGYTADGGEARASARGPRRPRANPPTADGSVVF